MQCGILRRRGLIRERLTESTEWRLLSARKARYAVTLSCLYQVWELSAFDLILSHSQKPNDHPSFKALLWCMACLFIPVICECTWSFGITAQFDTSAQILFLSQLDSKESFGSIGSPPTNNSKVHSALWN